MRSSAPESASISTGLVSAFGASACCVLPLALVSVGLGGAWVAQLRAFALAVFSAPASAAEPRTVIRFPAKVRQP